MAEGGRENNADYSGGYNKHWFVNEERALEYICGQCLKVLRDPQQIVCGHQVCRSCLPNEVKKCPTCDKDVRPNEVFADEAARRKIAKLPMKCRSTQCNWNGTLQEFEQTHHEEKCLRIPVPCPNKCGNEIPREEVDNHVDKKCERTLIDCTFTAVGCGDKVQRRNLRHHEETMVYEHLSQTLLALKNLGQEKKAMADEIKQLQEKNNKLTGELRNLSERGETRANQIESDLNEIKEMGSAKLDGVEKATEKKIDSLAQVVQQSGVFEEKLSLMRKELETLKCTTIPGLQADCIANQISNKKLVEKMKGEVDTNLSTAHVSLRQEMESQRDILSTALQDERIKGEKYEARTEKEILQLKKDISKNASALEKLKVALTITEDEMKEKFQDHSQQMQLDYDNLFHLVTKEKHSR